MNDTIFDAKRKALEERINSLGGDGERICEALKKLYSVYSNDMLVWLGSLYDPRIGGFYYSVSAKNSDGYLPDIESTYQAVVLLKLSGAISEYRDIPEKMRKRMAGFICSLEDSDSGYFYHPQWSRELTDEKMSRKGRDLSWAIYLSHKLEFEFPYPSATARLAKGSTDAKTNESKILSSEENFISYLKERDFNGNPTVAFHSIISISDQIKSAGFGDALIDYLDGIQNKENGFWTDAPDISCACVFWGVASLYSSVGRQLKNADKVAEYIVKELMIKISSIDIFEVYAIRNLWGALHSLLDNIASFGEGDSKVKEIKRLFMDKAAEVIYATADKLAAFKKPTGAFSLHLNDSPRVSQGVPVAPENTVGGDVNATGIAVGMLRSVKRLLGIEDLGLNIFDHDDFKKFICAVDSN